MGKAGPKPRSIDEAWEYLLSIAEKEGDCLLIKKGRPIGIGYRAVRAEGREWYAHRLSYRKKEGILPHGLVIMHICDKPNCINPAHLLGGTHADNVADKVAKGRHQKGSTHYKAVLSEDQVKQIKASPKNYAELSKEFGISRGGIHNIKSGRSWKHV